MEKTLKTIQTFAKVGKILSKIAYICCLVGGIGCTVVLVLLVLIKTQSFGTDGAAISSLIPDSNINEVSKHYANLAAAIVICAGQAALSRVACKSFETQLKEGTPFSFKVADACKNLGIKAIWIPIVTIVGAQTVFQIVSYYTGASDAFHFDYTASVGVGVVFIALSFICRYGAELLSEKQEEPVYEEL